MVFIFNINWSFFFSFNKKFQNPLLATSYFKFPSSLVSKLDHPSSVADTDICVLFIGQVSALIEKIDSVKD